MSALLRARWFPLAGLIVGVAILAGVLALGAHRASAERTERRNALACDQLAAGYGPAVLADRYAPFVCAR